MTHKPQFLSIQTIAMTPYLASTLMQANTANRPKRAAYASSLARIMRRGEWKTNGDTIRVSRSGVVLDGQHRLQAIIESGLTVTVILVTGLDDDVFSTIDRGLGRKTSDSLAINKEKNYTVLAAIARVLHMYEQTGNPYSKNSFYNPTTDQLIDLINARPGLRQSANFAKSSVWLKKHLTATTAGFCHFIFSRHDPEATHTFFDVLSTGVGLNQGSPILLLRNRLLDVQTDKGKITSEYRAALTFKAFKNYKNGSLVKNLRIRTEGDSAEKDLFVL